MFGVHDGNVMPSQDVMWSSPSFAVRSGIALTKEGDIKALASSVRRLEEQLTRTTAEVVELRVEKLERAACMDTLKAQCSSLTTQLEDAAELRAANELLESRLRSANAELIGLRLEKVCSGTLGLD